MKAPLLKRIPPTVWTGLVWGVVPASPVALLLTVRPGVQAGPQAVLPVLATLLPLVLLRRRPLLGLALMLGAAYLGVVTFWWWWFGAVECLVADLALVYIALSRPRRESLWGAALICVAMAGAVPNWLGVNGFGARVVDVSLGVPLALLYLLATCLAWLVGRYLHQHRAYTESLRSRHAAQAATAERLQIARELHDMVAHSIGIIAIQAGVGSRVMDTQPEEARNALRAIEATSRETLAGLRRTLGALRRPVAGQTAQASPREPAPGLGDVERLAETTGKAGVRVAVRWVGERRALAPEVDLSGFRIIQEALTNVVRHAGVTWCQVLIDCREEELVIEITDRGSGAVGGGGAGGGDGSGGAGFGLIGMRERVALLHGEFSAGPRAEGGFRVAARLPLGAGMGAGTGVAGR
ncbi:sensor histidine kinase [Kitasatospora sp. NPDC008050]|uniref:sensor histidine kinase n=1 Tax=Kitasatospora sp. NPDC008050 TaxID=3364021 RepID=UPI0036E67C5A